MPGNPSRPDATDAHRDVPTAPAPSGKVLGAIVIALAAVLVAYGFLLRSELSETA